MTPQRVAVRWIDGEAQGAPFAYVARPASDPPIGGVLLLHEAFGLNTDIQILAGRLAERGYAVLAPDLYRRGPDRLAGYDERAKAIAMLKTLPDGQVLDDTERGLDLLDRETGGAALGVVGLRIGGLYALLAAAREQGRIRAAVSYYGAGIDGGTISPLWTLNAIEQVQALRTPMLLFFVGDDPTVPSAELDSIDARLRSGGAAYEIVRYPGVSPDSCSPAATPIARARPRMPGIGSSDSWSALWEGARR